MTLSEALEYMEGISQMGLDEALDCLDDMAISNNGNGTYHMPSEE